MWGWTVAPCGRNFSLSLTVELLPSVFSSGVEVTISNEVPSRFYE